jgi:hypothetical protein
MRALLLGLLIPILAVAQPQSATGIIHGVVISATTQEPIFGANVVVVGTTRGASTDVEGKFSIGGLPVGTYAIRVSTVGYTAVIETDIVVNTIRPADVIVRLVESELKVEGVEVTASYFQKLPDKPVSTLTQTNEEIRRLPGGLEDVVRAISILPGVAQVQAGRNDLIVRGGAPSENLFLIDNIEVPNINHFGTQGASGGPLSYVNLDFVRETSFSTGGFGARYGDKLSSVLTINLRDGRDDAFGGKATISASQFGLNLEGPVSEQGTFLFSARRSYLDFIFKAAGFGFVPEYWDFLGKLQYRLGPKDELRILGIAALDNVRFFNETQDQRYDNSQVLGNDQNQIVTGVTWKHLFGSGYTSVTASRVDVAYEFIQSDSLLQPIFQSSSREVETSLRGEVVWLLPNALEISGGIVTKAIAFRSDIALSSFPTNFGQNLSVSSNLRTGGWKAAAFAQVSKGFGATRVIAGVRGDYFDLISAPVTLSPRISLSHAVNPVLSVNASVGRYYQSPSYVWLVGNAQNRTLDPIRADQAVLGTEVTLRPDTRLSLEVYRKWYGDYPASTTRTYLVMANTGAGFGGSEDGFAAFGTDPLINGGEGGARGVELLLQKKLSEVPCYGTVSVSYNQAEFRALDGVTRPGSFDQRWIVNIGGGYVLDDRWEFSTKFRLATGRPYTPYGPGGAQDPARYNSMRVGTNHSLDVRVDRRWQFGRWNLITYIDIQNVYNRQPLDVPRFDRRTGREQVNDSIGILPSIGVTAEF